MYFFRQFCLGFITVDVTIERQFIAIPLDMHSVRLNNSGVSSVFCLLHIPQGLGGVDGLLLFIGIGGVATNNYTSTVGLSDPHSDPLHTLFMELLLCVAGNRVRQNLRITRKCDSQ
ncbi:hypothetical protein CRENPOLYSF2_3160002 [Crenothrix polyspora]|uniref:Uncharacterized protein n=1 Tax=Crenothrix polyspora TaxID=360316 RepID=A0A1R4HAL7_9GAMM|nr:hypothetical protein CRENPOLYSF2_3160002 [Crenothrix polyspora]